MRFPYAIDMAHGLTVVTMPATVRAEDLAETVYALFADPRWARGFNSIWDGSEIEDVNVALSDLPGLVQIQRDQQHLSGPGIDVVVVTNPIGRSLALAYATLARAGHRRTHVVRTMSEAYELVGAKRDRDGST